MSRLLSRPGLGAQALVGLKPLDNSFIEAWYSAAEEDGDHHITVY
jgi:hypothetical protein